MLFYLRHKVDYKKLVVEKLVYFYWDDPLQKNDYNLYLKLFMSFQSWHQFKVKKSALACIVFANIELKKYQMIVFFLSVLFFLQKNVVSVFLLQARLN